MHYSTLFSLAFVAGVSAQNATVTVLNPWLQMSTLTQLGSDSVATTYTKTCTGDGKAPETRSGFPPLVTCAPLSLKQGPSTWEIHMTELGSDGDAFDASCKFKENGYNGDGDCTFNFKGPGPAALGYKTTPTTEVTQPTFWKDGLEPALQSVLVIRAEATPSASGSGNGSSNAAPKAPSGGSPAPSASSSPPAKSNNGHATFASTPITLLAFMGGAAGIFAAGVFL